MNEKFSAGAPICACVGDGPWSRPMFNYAKAKAITHVTAHPQVIPIVRIMQHPFQKIEKEKRKMKHVQSVHERFASLPQYFSMARQLLCVVLAVLFLTFYVS